MEQKRIEGLWDCAYCGQKGIKARFAECGSCGRPRGPETIFYLPSDTDAATLTKEEAARTSKGPDWLCPYCNTLNRSDAQYCEGCGADRTSSTENYGTLHQSTGMPFRK